LKNPTFLFLALATCTEGMIVSGIAAFGAKFFQEKFNLPAAFAALLMGQYSVVRNKPVKKTPQFPPPEMYSPMLLSAWHHFSYFVKNPLLHTYITVSYT
jgi:hypothetical protein